MVAAFIAMLLTTAQPCLSDTVTVDIEGLAGAQLNNARKYLSLWRDRKRDKLDARRIRILHSKAAEQLKASLEAYGYFRADVVATLTQDGDHWRAFYSVKPGDPVTIRNAKIALVGEGQVDPVLLPLVTGHEFAVGVPLDQVAYEAYKNTLLSKAHNLGYLDAGFTAHRVDISRDPYYADIDLVLDTGSRYFFGEVIFNQQGLHRYDQALLSRFVTIKAGQPYQPSRLIALQSTLLDSLYFSSVEVEKKDPAGTETSLPIEVRSEADRTYKYRFGGGFGTDTGPRVSARHERVVNPAGHKFSAELQVSPKSPSGNLDYSIPLADPTSEKLSFIVNVVQKDTDSRESRIFTTGVFRIKIRDKWTETLGIKAEVEDYDIGDETGNSVLVMPHASWTRVVANDPLYPSRGWRMGLELLAASEVLGSDVDFLRANWSGKYVRDLSRRSRILLRGNSGATWTQDFNALPASKRFFAGGDQSVRGYDFEELGATNSEGDVRGGRYLLVGSAEYERRFNEKWSGAAFFDVGNAFNGFGDPLKKAVGIGLRMRTPIGPVRLDLAHGFDDPDAALRIHVVLGPDL